MSSQTRRCLLLSLSASLTLWQMAQQQPATLCVGPNTSSLRLPIAEEHSFLILSSDPLQCWDLQFQEVPEVQAQSPWGLHS